jgi:hypothetical protein
MLLVQGSNVVADLVAHDSFERAAIRSDDMNLEVPSAERSGDLEPDEAGT